MIPARYNNGNLVLSKNEYAKISSIIHNKQAQNLDYKGKNFAYSDKYFYIFDDNGFDDFQIKGKIKITENEQLINYIEEAIRNGNNIDSKEIDRWVSDNEIRQGFDYNGNVGIENQRNSTKNDRISKDILQESKENTNAARSNKQNDGNKGLDNSSFSNVKNNKGRTLSKQQAEYFKDSKVRDEDGNLLEVYHGTPNEFNVFNYDNLGNRGTTEGIGFYFTNNEKYASEYGKTKKVYLDIKKPLSLSEKTISKSELKTLLTAMNERNDYLSNYGDISYEGLDKVLNEAIKLEYDSNDNDVDIIDGILNASGMNEKEYFNLLVVFNFMTDKSKNMVQ